METNIENSNKKHGKSFCIKPFTEVASTPLGAVKLCCYSGTIDHEEEYFSNDKTINQRTAIVEFGSGISSLYVASILRQLGSGKIISIEHDQSWANYLQDMINREELADFIQLNIVPLSQSDQFSLPWYDISCLRQCLSGLLFDSVIIDGPPAYTDSLSRSRYPALPFLMRDSYLKQSFSLFLDDVDRSGERFILKQWSLSYGMKFLTNEVANVAYYLHGSHFQI